MIPNLVSVRWRRPDGRWLRLHVPVLPVLVLLSPLLLLAALGAVVACLVTGMNPAGALYGAWQLLRALRGTRIEVEDADTAFLISVR